MIRLITYLLISYGKDQKEDIHTEHYTSIPEDEESK